MLTTHVTQVFSTRLPIVAGGLMWLANADYVAAAARAGIMGYISASSFPEPEALRNEIHRCRDLCEGRSFGVNVSMLPRPAEGERVREVFELIAREGVRFVETSGRNPDAFLALLKAEGITVTHKVASVKHAVKAQDSGVDMVAIVGNECGGHPGLEMVGTMVNAAWARQALRIPYLIGGGIGHGSQIAAALAMGAAGVLIGTRFLVSEEIWAHRNYKQKLVDSQPGDTTLCMHAVRNPIRVLRNVTTETVQEMERTNPALTIQDLLPHVAGTIGRNAYATGDWSKGLLSAGQALAFVDRIEPLAQIVQTLEDELDEALQRVHALSTLERNSPTTPHAC